jgi:gluconokinase
VFSGGALEKVPVWQPIVCDAIGAPAHAKLESEASARGAALLALEALGDISDAGDMPPAMGAALQPNRENHLLTRVCWRNRTRFTRKYMSRWL